MTATVVFIQGAGPGAYDEDASMVESLRRELGHGVAVVFPRMPDDDDLKTDPWSDAIGAAISDAESPLVLVGHSAGGFQLVHYLAEHEVGAVSIHLIAAPFPGGDPDWTFEGFDLPDRLPPGDRTFLSASEDDEIVPFAHRDRWAAAIPGARIRTTTGGHQLGNDLRPVADDIREALNRA